MNRNILFRADSSSTIGTGHIMRDLVLAKRDFKEDNIIFAVRDLEGNINYKITEAGYKIVILKSNDINELDKVIKKYNIDMIIIDNYEIDYEYERQLSILNSKLSIMVLDDTYEKHYCNILLNHNIYAEKNRYRDLVPSFCELKCGEKYTLLRDEFYKERKIKREKIYDVFIAMGGADTQNLNIKILKILPNYFRVAVVTTNANKNLKDLQEYIKDKNNIDLFINSNKIARLINQSKFAIVTPSVIVHEVLHLDIPFLAIKTAANQSEFLKYLIKKKFLALKCFDKDFIKKIILNLKRSEK